ncbi:MAG: undecaprenyl-diphosphate phosphatase [Alphaproteobacteria bacterium]|nr:undecaprenyl-diphosphate phosphatase [Alphaproteobacteria bacterium]
METWQVIVLGIIEGATEFLPVSSTGHILLAAHFLGVESPGKTFEVLIQLGAILAVLSVYFAKLWQIFLAAPNDPNARRFIVGILLAFLPAAVVGVLAHSFIKGVLFNETWLICAMLIVGGLVLLVVDRLALTPRYHEAMQYPPSLAFKIGLFQCLALVPGVSRSGATIVGALLMGTDKRSAAEFSFLLALPTMFGAFAYDLYKNWHLVEPAHAVSIGLGFVTAFVAAVLVVRHVLDFISRYGFSFFAWWRILVGSLGLLGLQLIG